jgi:hypothetical protein
MEFGFGIRLLGGLSGCGDRSLRDHCLHLWMGRCCLTVWSSRYLCINMGSSIDAITPMTASVERLDRIEAILATLAEGQAAFSAGQQQMQAQLERTEAQVERTQVQL